MQRPAQALSYENQWSITSSKLHKENVKSGDVFGSGIDTGRKPVSRAMVEMQDQSGAPLLETPRKVMDADANIFAAAEGSAYFQDSHMATTRSTSRSRRLAAKREASSAKQSRPSPSHLRRSSDGYICRDESSSDSDGDSFDHIAADDDPRNKLTRQVKSLSRCDVEDSQPKLEIVSHKSLDRIKPFDGKRNKNEKSIQWLKTFVYEMKGARTPLDLWCLVFELSLRGGAIHWFRQPPKKTRRKWKLLSQEFVSYYCSQFAQPAQARYYLARRNRTEHLCDYLNRLNGYARNACLQIEKGERNAKDHVQQFLLA